MVLRTTEYRLQFNTVTNDLRKQIWLENLRLRGLLRSTNQADHYWAHQLVAEYCEENETTAKDNVLGLNRPQHEEVVDNYNNGKGDTLEHATNSPHLQRDLHSAIGREIALQTPNWEEEFPHRYDSSQELQRLANDVSLTSMCGDEQVESLCRPSTPVPPRTPLTVAELVHNTQPIPCDVHQSGCSSDRSKSSLHTLTRTARKNYFEIKPSPFESYGWNDMKKDIGEKKTYNIHAPKKEVNKHALDAFNRRRCDIEQYLAEEAEKQRKVLKGSSLNISNHSSIWMTEYAENFSPKRKNKVFFNENLSRPQTAPSTPKPCWWRTAL